MWKTIFVIINIVQFAAGSNKNPDTLGIIIEEVCVPHQIAELERYLNEFDPPEVPISNTATYPHFDIDNGAVVELVKLPAAPFTDLNEIELLPLGALPEDFKRLHILQDLLILPEDAQLKSKLSILYKILIAANQRAKKSLLKYNNIYNYSQDTQTQKINMGKNTPNYLGDEKIDALGSEKGEKRNFLTTSRQRPERSTYNQNYDHTDSPNTKFEKDRLSSSASFSTWTETTRNFEGISDPIKNLDFYNENLNRDIEIGEKSNFESEIDVPKIEEGYKIFRENESGREIKEFFGEGTRIYNQEFGNTDLSLKKTAKDSNFEEMTTDSILKNNETDLILLENVTNLDFKETTTSSNFKENVIDSNFEKTITNSNLKETTTSSNFKVIVTDSNFKENVTADSESNEIITSSNFDKNIIDSKLKTTVTYSTFKDIVTDLNFKENVTDSILKKVVPDSTLKKITTSSNFKEIVIDSNSKETTTAASNFEKIVTNLNFEENVTDSILKKVVPDSTLKKITTSSNFKEIVIDSNSKETTTAASNFEKIVTNLNFEENVTDSILKKGVTDSTLKKITKSSNFKEIVIDSNSKETTTAASNFEKIVTNLNFEENVTDSILKKGVTDSTLKKITKSSNFKEIVIDSNSKETTTAASNFEKIVTNLNFEENVTDLNLKETTTTSNFEENIISVTSSNFEEGLTDLNFEKTITDSDLKESVTSTNFEEIFTDSNFKKLITNKKPIKSSPEYPTSKLYYGELIPLKNQHSKGVDNKLIKGKAYDDPESEVTGFENRKSSESHVASETINEMRSPSPEGKVTTKEIKPDVRNEDLETTITTLSDPFIRSSSLLPIDQKNLRHFTFPNESSSQRHFTIPLPYLTDKISKIYNYNEGLNNHKKKEPKFYTTEVSKIEKDFFKSPTTRRTFILNVAESFSNIPRPVEIAIKNKDQKISNHISKVRNYEDEKYSRINSHLQAKGFYDRNKNRLQESREKFSANKLYGFQNFGRNRTTERHQKRGGHNTDVQKLYRWFYRGGEIPKKSGPRGTEVKCNRKNSVID